MRSLTRLNVATSVLAEQSFILALYLRNEVIVTHRIIQLRLDFDRTYRGLGTEVQQQQQQQQQPQQQHVSIDRHIIFRRRLIVSHNTVSINRALATLFIN